jgi:hypothetical protein
MKKLTSITLLLVFTSTAAATNVDKTIQLTLGGEVVDEITVNVVDTIPLGITLRDGWDMDAMELDLEIIVLSGEVDTLISFDPYVTVPEDIIVASFDDWSKKVEDITPTGIGSIVGMTFGAVTGKLVDHILLNVHGVGYIVVQLTDIGANNSPTRGDIDETMMGSVVISVGISEPCSLALLGLGGLLLRRKRRG